MVALYIDRRTHQPYKDHLCFFRALSITLSCICRHKCKCKRPKELLTKKLFATWKQKSGYSGNISTFQGVTMQDLCALESLFKVSIAVYQLHDNDVGTCVWNANAHHPKKMHLNLYKNHFSLIKDLPSYAKSWVCENCGENFAQ